MKRSFLFALALVAGLGVAFAQNLPTEGNYTYYLEDACNEPIVCSDSYDGPLCSQEFSGTTVYDAPSCVTGHEVTTVLGKLPL